MSDECVIAHAEDSIALSLTSGGRHSCAAREGRREGIITLLCGAGGKEGRNNHIVVLCGRENSF